MKAIEHLKTLCCLGLPPESAMVAVVPVLHEIIPHGWVRLALVAPDATMTEAYAEHPETGALFRERMWRFVDDPSAPASLWVPSFRANWDRLDFAFPREGLAGERLVPGNRGSTRFLLDFGRDDRRRRPDFCFRPPDADASTQRPPLHGGRRAASRPAPALARACVPAVSVRWCAPGKG